MGDGEVFTPNTKKSYLLKKPTPITNKLTEVDQQILIDQIRNSQMQQDQPKEVFPTEPYKAKKAAPLNVRTPEIITLV
jgi:hypothetical protein